jgi:hypothetical protein
MEIIFPAERPYQVGWNAFLLNEQCRYRPKSFYSREWLRGWNCAYLKIRRDFVLKQFEQEQWELFDAPAKEAATKF